MTLSRILISPFPRLSDGRLRQEILVLFAAAQLAMGAPRGALGGAVDLYIGGRS